MSDSIDLQAIAREIKRAQDEALRIEPVTDRFKEFDVASAYQVAQFVHEARLRDGNISVGRKIGFTNPALWDVYGVREPIWAHVYDATVVQVSGGDATCDIGGFVEPKIEPEIVVHFGSTPPVGADHSEILGCIDWIAHGIEIVQSHFPGWKFEAADTVADGALHGALLVGEPLSLASLSDNLIRTLEDFSITLYRSGEVMEVGRGSNVLGSPLAAVDHLITVLADFPDATSLKSNELVTTGTLTAAFPIHTGETWSTELEGISLPGISVNFVEQGGPTLFKPTRLTRPKIRSSVCLREHRFITDKQLSRCLYNGEYKWGIPIQEPLRGPTRHPVGPQLPKYDPTPANRWLDNALRRELLSGIRIFGDRSLGALKRSPSRAHGFTSNPATSPRTAVLERPNSIASAYRV